MLRKLTIVLGLVALLVAAPLGAVADCPGLITETVALVQDCEHTNIETRTIEGESVTVYDLQVAHSYPETEATYPCDETVRILVLKNANGDVSVAILFHGTVYRDGHELTLQFECLDHGADGVFEQGVAAFMGQPKKIGQQAIEQFLHNTVLPMVRNAIANSWYELDETVHLKGEQI